MDWKVITDWCMANIEYSAILTFPLIFWFLAKNKYPKTRNDATPYIIKYKKQQDSINQRSKGMMIK